MKKIIASLVFLMVMFNGCGSTEGASDTVTTDTTTTSIDSDVEVLSTKVSSTFPIKVLKTRGPVITEGPVVTENEMLLGYELSERMEAFLFNNEFITKEFIFGFVVQGSLISDIEASTFIDDVALE